MFRLFVILVLHGKLHNVMKIKKCAIVGTLFALWSDKNIIKTTRKNGDEFIVNIILVDDDRVSLNALNTVVKCLGFQAITFDRPTLALERYTSTKFDLAILDVVMPEMSGIELAKKIRALDPNVRIVLVSGRVCDDFERDMAGINPPVSFLLKPLDAEIVQKIINAAWEEVPSNRMSDQYK